jgi:hypothetical protein
MSRRTSEPFRFPEWNSIVLADKPRHPISCALVVADDGRPSPRWRDHLKQYLGSFAVVAMFTLALGSTVTVEAFACGQNCECWEETCNTKCADQGIDEYHCAPLAGGGVDYKCKCTPPI